MAVLAFLYSGILLGLSQGFSPGPHSALVITQTLRFSLKEGIKVAVAPIVATIPILLLCGPIAALAARANLALGAISIVGALFLLKLGWENLSLQNFIVEPGATAEPASFWRGAFTALLSPHPYLFWITIGTPQLVKGWALTPWTAVLFFLGFMTLFVLAKVALALLSLKLKKDTSASSILFIMRAMGIVMAGIGLAVGWDGLKLLGVA